MNALNDHAVSRSGVAKPESTRIEAIDGFRALAMLLVLIYHTWVGMGSPVWTSRIGGWQVDWLAFVRGNTRVDLFIILSGFCLFLPLCKSSDSWAKWDWKQYASRRARRILPGYYAALVFAILFPNFLVLLMRALGKPASWQPWPSPGDVISHLFFVHTWFSEHWETINGSLWTMALEVHFYLLFPLLILALRRFGLFPTVFGFFCLSLIYNLFGPLVISNAQWPNRFLFSATAIGRGMEFSVGIISVWLVMKMSQQKQRLSSWVGTLMIVAALALHQLASTPEAVSIINAREILLSGAFFLLIVAVCCSHTPLRFLLENKLMSSLGFISYSLFLVHQPIAYFTTQFFLKVAKIPAGVSGFLLAVVVSFVLTLLVGLPFFRLFEWPYLKQNRKPRAPSRPLPAEISTRLHVQIRD